MALAQGGERCGWDTSEPALGLEHRIREAVLSSSHSSEPREGMLTFARQSSVSYSLLFCSLLGSRQWARELQLLVPPSERQRVGCRGRC